MSINTVLQPGNSNSANALSTNATARPAAFDSLGSSDKSSSRRSDFHPRCRSSKVCAFRLATESAQSSPIHRHSHSFRSVPSARDFSIRSTKLWRRLQHGLQGIDHRSGFPFGQLIEAIGFESWEVWFRRPVASDTISQIREFIRGIEMSSVTVVDGIATREVARQLNMSEATVRQSRSRILRRLRLQFGDIV